MNRIAIAIAVAIGVTLAHLQLYSTEWGQRLEHLSLDLWFQVRGSIPPPDDLVVVAMDEYSYDELGIPYDKAWPRAVHAMLLERLHELGAKRVIFDVLFLGSSGDEESDQELAAALALLPTVIGVDTADSSGSVRITKLLKPYEPFVESVEQLGFVGLPHENGYVRRFRTVDVKLQTQFPSLAEGGAGREIPKRPGQRDYINFYGPAGTIPTLSYYQVLDPNWNAASELKGKTVFVGLLFQSQLGPAQKDSFLTPYSQRFQKNDRTFGVEIHAQAAGNLRAGNWITRLSDSSEKIILSILVALLSFVLLSVRPHWGAIVYVGSTLLWIITAFILFLNGSFLPGAITFIAVLPFVLLISSLFYYFVSSRSERLTQNAFEHYLPIELAREAAKNPDSLKVGGETIYATALFTDIVSFTNISEDMLAEEVSKMLSSYFNEVVEVVFENQGTLIKFIGDAIFALWGAPVKFGDHAAKAVESAFLIQEAVSKFNSQSEFPRLDTRIGVHTGPMVVGNLGAHRRFDYTAVGDSINLAARCEGLNSYFGSQIIVTESTYKESKTERELLELGRVAVKGKQDSLTIFGAFSAQIKKRAAERWGDALYEFSARNWDEAQKIFQEVQNAEPLLEKASGLYLQQIELYQSEEPAKEWRGEIVFRTK